MKTVDLKNLTEKDLALLYRGLDNRVHAGDYDTDETRKQMIYLQDKILDARGELQFKVVDAIKNNALLKQVLDESHGGICYTCSQSKYNSEEKDKLIALWDSLSEGNRDEIGGLMTGAIMFLKEQE